MAFKRSAVRSRLSPPPSPENHWFSGLFLCQNGGFTPKIRFSETAPEPAKLAEPFVPELYQNYPRRIRLPGLEKSLQIC